MFRCARKDTGPISPSPVKARRFNPFMSSSKTLGFGIIGCGVIADFHAQAIANLTGARLVGVADQIEAAVTKLAAKHKVGFATTNVAELLARPDIDIVCVTTPSGAHLEPALAAVKAGKHVVVEKPIEITTERVDELLKAADAAGVKIAAIFQSRFGNGARTVKAALDAGRFGKLVLCSAYVKWRRPSALEVEAFVLTILTVAMLPLTAVGYLKWL